ncbi:MAG: ABC transporter ATP-binding protein [Flavobacteriaceae bacterium]|jgi:ABC-2 type transport system ATP-binding protein|nr:ABC transporter ATP-binding protein [Flavobacteriaceae bacterium]
MNPQKAITAKNLTKTFGDFVAVNKISFEVSEGEIFGFLGANGAGKTTAMRMLCGLLHPSSGEGHVAGFDIFRQAQKIKENIGYMSQRFSLYDDLTTFENMRLFGGIYGMSNSEIKSRADYWFSELSLKNERNLLTKSLPLGIKQKVAFSVATFHHPKIVFLDEPTGGVDPIARRTFWELIYKAADEGMTVFVTTHYMDEAEYCHRISIMVDGEIHALDTPQNLKKALSAENIYDVFIKLAREAERGE